MHDNAKLCKECGGRCCKALPGSTWPSDFGDPTKPEEIGRAVTEAVRGGRYAVDWWEGDEVREYFVRPATLGKEGVTHDASWGGVCTFLTMKKGCSLKSEDRPTMCQRLIPVMGFGCGFGGKAFDKHDSALAWEEWWAELEAMGDG